MMCYNTIMNQQKKPDNMDRWVTQKDYLIALIIGQASRVPICSIDIDEAVELSKKIDASHPEPIWHK